MSDSTQLEFTGERVVPGLVDPNLLNEHVARYRFASLFASGRRVLDAGCGSGYGAAEFTDAASVVAMDVAPEAVRHANRAFGGPRTTFLQARCEALPFEDASFDLVAAFEVIEHVEAWGHLLTEARRVLRHDGVLLVSTPNKAFYADSRANAGPNPFHVHEFEYEEFESALSDVFPHVQLWTQNHSEVIAFVPPHSSQGVLEAPADNALADANFFVAACSQSPIPRTGSFGWLATSGNVLRERQNHIHLLETEIAKKNAWLDEAQRAQAALQREYDKLAEYHAQELEKARGILAGMRKELDTTRAAYEDKIMHLEQDAKTRLQWVRDLEEQIAQGHAEILRQREEIGALGNTLTERTEWAHSLESTIDVERGVYRARESELRQTEAHLVRTLEELEHAKAELARVQAERERVSGELAMSDTSKWVRLGRGIHLMFPKPVNASEGTDSNG